MRLRSAIAAVVLLAAASVHAEVVIETVTVGNPGNAGEDSGDCVPGGWGPCRECGAVDYVYNIGKFEVTAGQYTEFLNAVAATDTYGLYNTYYMPNPAPPDYGCNIQRTGLSGSYSYSVAGDWADRPVNGVSWGDAARFANWLHNGQPTAAQGPGTTEDGSYALNGATSNAALLLIVRDPDAIWVIPSEDEWYKAAYYDGGSGVYYDYATGSDSVPVSEACPGGSNSANYWDVWYAVPPFWRNEVGCYVSSASPYATFD
ncbi:MAG: SUMF1/EgtB/PvdO family nonheme iron enzyme, partial [Planctomycetota bacterium]